MLDARVQERTHELQTSKSELERTLVSLKKAQDMLIQSEKLAGLGSVVVAVAHELNTPLGNCLTVASTLIDKVKEMNKQVSSGNIRRSQLDEYLSSVDTGMQLIIDGLRQAADQVSNFKQVAVDQESQQRRQFDLAAVVEGVAMLLNVSSIKTPFVLELEVPEGLIMNSFPGPVEQIISNLVNNSVMHGFNGRSEGKMRLTARREVDEIRIDYADDGIGMSENTVHRIFDPFFTTQLGKGGSGLGMTICYNLITGLLGGSIEVASTIGTGSTFKILLPVEAPSLAAQNTHSNRTDRA
jgi:signal transduction histidine kinase